MINLGGRGYMITKEEIRNRAKEMGLDPVGFTHSGPLDRIKRALEERKKLGYLSGLEVGTLGERCCPSLHLDEVKSIIAVGLPYSIPPKKGGDSTGSLSGTISGSVAGEDYHRVIRSKLQKLAEYISGRVEYFKYYIMVDTGPLVDREIAFRSGIGWYGKNCSIISPEYGSGIFLGEMLTNIDLEPDESVERDCRGCNLCIENCPTGALVEPYVLDAKKCVSYLTQMRGVVPRDLRSKMGTSIYGCDRCQQCCPYNTEVKAGSYMQNLIAIKQLLEMDRREFQEKHGTKAFAWRGLNVLKRNAVIALGNLKSQEGLPLLEKALKHPSPVIRGHAAWAIGQIDGLRGRKMLEKALAGERDAYVADEIMLSLEEIKKDPN